MHSTAGKLENTAAFLCRIARSQGSFSYEQRVCPCVLGQSFPIPAQLILVCQFAAALYPRGNCFSVMPQDRYVATGKQCVS